MVCIIYPWLENLLDDRFRCDLVGASLCDSSQLGKNDLAFDIPGLDCTSLTAPQYPSAL